MTFDEVLPSLAKVFTNHSPALEEMEWLLVNRDLYGRVRLIAPESVQINETKREALENLATEVLKAIKPHAYPLEQVILYESDRETALQNASSFPFQGYANISIVDRLAAESEWSHIAPEAETAPRFVFFSIKGGVGRSTALAAVAWRLAQEGKRVLVLDLDLESPGLSTSLLPAERQPKYGITDWLVEDLVDNTSELVESMFATSSISGDGEIYVVPAHGKEAGEYVSKLGRVWMPKVGANGVRETWSARLGRLLSALEDRIKPDVILIDSRAGIDEVASTCVTELGAKLVLLFALEGTQTWSGFQILFKHWQQRKSVEAIRERVQVVGAMVPELNSADYTASLREHAYELFADSLYDDIPPGEPIEGRWHFEASDEVAPHYPWTVKWHRSFAGLQSLQGRLVAIDDQEVRNIFGPLIDGITTTLGWETVDA